MARLFPVADELGVRFAAAGHQLHLVGGTVRDALLGVASSDLDLTTDASPERVLALIDGWADATWTTGIEYGTVGAAKRGMRLEITTFRTDVYDRVSRNPVVRYGESLEEDLRRRDFTVNAMAVSVPDHTFSDPSGGLADLAGRVLRTPSEPVESFQDDPLRLLRAVRFVSQLGFDIEPRTAAAMAQNAATLARIVPERIQHELTRLMLGASPGRALELMVDSGLAQHVLPELPALRMEIDEHRQHKDVYAHTLQVLQQAIDLEQSRGWEPDLVLRLAALMHDVGKPATRKSTPQGKVTFHHHDVVGAKMTRRRLGALRYSKDVIADVSRLVELHLRFYGYRRGQWTDSAVRRYVTDAGDLLPRLHLLVRADCTTRNRRRAAALSGAYDALEERIARLQEQEDLRAVRPDLDGNEIMAILGLTPGPLVGEAWRHLKEQRMEKGPMPHDEAVAELRRWALASGIEPPPSL